MAELWCLSLDTQRILAIVNWECVRIKGYSPKKQESISLDTRKKNKAIESECLENHSPLNEVTVFSKALLLLGVKKNKRSMFFPRLSAAPSYLPGLHPRVRSYQEHRARIQPAGANLWMGQDSLRKPLIRCMTYMISEFSFL